MGAEEDVRAGFGEGTRAETMVKDDVRVKGGTMIKPGTRMRLGRDRMMGMVGKEVGMGMWVAVATGGDDDDNDDDVSYALANFLMMVRYAPY